MEVKLYFVIYQLGLTPVPPRAACRWLNQINTWRNEREQVS
jgi:hypothetical protein